MSKAKKQHKKQKQKRYVENKIKRIIESGTKQEKTIFAIFCVIGVISVVFTAISLILSLQLYNVAPASASVNTVVTIPVAFIMCLLILKHLCTGIGLFIFDIAFIFCANSIKKVMIKRNIEKVKKKFKHLV